jgi:two-component system KDP operon response regulator KdpE
VSARVLVIDDEAQLRLALKRGIEAHGYSVRDAPDAASGLRAFDAFKPDVVLLDLMLPDADGVDVCRAIRARSATPIIVLSVVGDEKTKIAALDQGADDYLTKPFSIGELLARVRAALRRSGDVMRQGVFKAGDLAIDVEARTVRVAGREVHLTPTEYALLKYLAQHAGKVLTHPMILRSVWGDDYAGDTHVLRTCVNQLRAKLGDNSAAPRYIRTDPGVGYRFIAAEDEP